MSDWIEWHGGEMPVKAGMLIEVEHRDGEKFLEPAGDTHCQDWSHETERCEDGDIVAYRVVDEDYNTIQRLQKRVAELDEALTDVLDGSSASYDIQYSTGLNIERCIAISNLFNEIMEKK